ncbi:hypothetical protein WICPIJ_000116 [Wickerhamomyces pijperi]|uniref:Genetic interactor of prohibitins 3, mitochondrial n=1 Tax=Wickerhamomyces pijperi TaxID=599730 RepID=A0A9P8TT90_WICPI|nr:hypothetical protein WICPIJ_000116 [Wickerhamomyces pijperi]
MIRTSNKSLAKCLRHTSIAGSTNLTASLRSKAHLSSRFNSSKTSPSQDQDSSLPQGSQSKHTESLNKSLDQYSLNPRTGNHDCASCGTLLQSVDPTSEGYYIKPSSIDQHKTSKPVSRSFKSTQYLSAFSKLDEEGKAMLLSQNHKDEDVIITSRKSTGDSKELEEELICERCHSAIHHSKYNTTTIQPLSLAQIIESIPVKSSMYHLFSAVDFPLSLLSQIPAREGDIKFIMNKTDMLFGHNSTLEKYDTYFKHLIRRLTGYKNSPLYMVSAHSNWGIKSLLQKLKDDVVYLVGYVNTGKTKFAQRLETSYKSLTTDKRSDYKKLLGSSHFPAMTRDTIEHRLTSRKSVIDTPGLIPAANVFNHIKSEHLKNLTHGKKMIISEMRKTEYHSAKSGQVVSIAGGLVLLKVPDNTIVQLKSACFGELRNFTNIERAKEVLTNQPDALKKSIFVKPESMNELQRFVIPPFRGTVDLLIKDIGFVQIKPTGSMPDSKTPELFEVFAPSGVVLGVRETIEHFLTGYIKSTKIREKKHYHKREVVKVTKSEKLSLKPKDIPDYKIFSRLYPVPMTCEDAYGEMVRQYEEYECELEGKKRLDNERDVSRNQFWIERL